MSINVGQAATQTATTSNDDTIIIYGDDGETYILRKSDWQKNEFKQQNLTDPLLAKLQGNGASGLVKQLVALGTYLAYIPPDFAEAIGACCTLVNLKAILSNRSTASRRNATASAPNTSR